MLSLSEIPIYCLCTSSCYGLASKMPHRCLRCPALPDHHINIKHFRRSATRSPENQRDQIKLDITSYSAAGPSKLSSVQATWFAGFVYSHRVFGAQIVQLYDLWGSSSTASVHHGWPSGEWWLDLEAALKLVALTPFLFGDFERFGKDAWS